MKYIKKEKRISCWAAVLILFALIIVCLGVYVKYRNERLREEISFYQFETARIVEENKVLEQEIQAIIKDINQQVNAQLLERRMFEALYNATFRIETGNGTSSLWINYNNAGGIKCGTDYCQFSDKEEGLARLKELLLDYVEIYGYDLAAIRNRYCGMCGEQDLQTFTMIFNEELGE